MSIFNYEGIRNVSFEPEVVYRFYPDYIGEENLAGKFKLNLDDWKPVIIEPANLYDERCAAALAYRIKKYFEENGELPERVFHIA
ncbi:MAG: hypothetical protein M3384_19855 [Acidobacteriota bacterium]|nr:hypothetical protein [Acidobacteriota bacterium]